MSLPSAVPPRLRFIASAPVEGLAVAERRVDEPLGTVLFVHGALDRGGSFARLARRLTSFDLVTYDRRGYQGSRDLRPGSLQDHIDDLQALVQREGDRAPVLLFGHSFGGVVTYGLAARHPELVRVVVNYESPLPWVRRRVSSRPPLGDDAAVEAERFFRRVVSSSAWDRLSAEQQHSRRLDGPALVRDLATIQSTDVPYDLSTIDVDSVYVHGDGELAPYYRDLAAALSAMNPRVTTIELVGANHAAHLKNADQLALVVREAWERVCTLG